MGVNEKPLLLQKRRFEQAGYTDLDPLDDIGREDNSYLSKLVYKPHRSSVVNIVNIFSQLSSFSRSLPLTNESLLLKGRRLE